VDDANRPRLNILAPTSHRLIDKMGIAGRKNCDGAQRYKRFGGCDSPPATISPTRPGVLLF
jgi:hypothetical protein